MTDGESGASAGETYAEFRLRIERGPSKRTYRVYATGPSGQVDGLFRLPFSDLELENFILKVRGTRSGVRSMSSSEAELAKDFGADLFDALFDIPRRSPSTKESTTGHTS